MGVFEVKREEHVIRLGGVDHVVRFGEDQIRRIMDLADENDPLKQTREMVYILVPDLPSDLDMDVILQIGSHLGAVVRERFGGLVRPLQPIHAQEADSS